MSSSAEAKLHDSITLMKHAVQPTSTKMTVMRIMEKINISFPSGLYVGGTGSAAQAQFALSKLNPSVQTGSAVATHEQAPVSSAAPASSHVGTAGSKVRQGG